MGANNFGNYAANILAKELPNSSGTSLENRKSSSSEAKDLLIFGLGLDERTLRDSIPFT